MSEAVLILRNMRGGCATVDNKVHALFRVTSRGARQVAKPDETAMILHDKGQPTPEANRATGGD